MSGNVRETTAPDSNVQKADTVEVRKAETPVKAAETPKPKPKKEVKPTQTNHKVRSGENLSKIARKYGVSVDDIKKANGLKNDNISAGETLKIPSKSSKSNRKKSRRRR